MVYFVLVVAVVRRSKTEGSWEEQQAKLKEIEKSTWQLSKEERKELSRVRARQRWENVQKSEARGKKMDEALEKLRKANQLENKGAGEENTHETLDDPDDPNVGQ